MKCGDCGGNKGYCKCNIVLTCVVCHKKFTCSLHTGVCIRNTNVTQFKSCVCDQCHFTEENLHRTRCHTVFV